MAVDDRNARIYGSDDDAVWIGPLGALAPTGLEEPTEHEDAGWLGEDGIPISPSDSVEKFRGHQGGRVIRTKMTSSETTFRFQALETKALTLGLQYNIREKTTTDGVTRTTMSSGRKVEARSFIVDLYDEAPDGTVHRRFEIPRGEIGERAEVVHSNNAITVYEFTVEIIGDWYEITDDPAVADEPVAP